MKKLLTKLRSLNKGSAVLVGIAIFLMAFALPVKATDYVYYIDVSTAKTKKAEWGTQPYAHVWDFGTGDVYVPLTLESSSNNIWKLEIKGASSEGKVHFLAQNSYSDGIAYTKTDASYEGSLNSGHLYNLYLKDSNDWRFSLEDKGTYSPVSADLYYYVGSSWGAGTKIQKGSSFTLENQSSDIFFLFGSLSTITNNWDSGKLYGSDQEGSGNSQSVTVGTQTTANYGKKGVFKLSKGKYTVKVDDFTDGASVKFTVTKYNGGGDITDTDYEYFISHKNPSSSSWTDSEKYRIEANGSKKFTVNLNNNDRFVIKSGGNTYGPQTEMGVNNNGSYNQTFGTASFVWVGDSGNVDITVTLDADGKPKSVSFAQESVTPGPDPVGAGIYMLTAYRNKDNNGLGTWTSKLLEASEDNANVFNYTITDYVGNKDFYIYFQKRDASGKTINSYGDNKNSFGDNGLNNRTYIDEGFSSQMTVWNGSVDCAYHIYRDAGEISFTLDFTNADQPTFSWTTRPETPDPNLAGNVYLIGTMLNDNVASPAWEMIPQGDGTYVIENFSMRLTENKGNDKNKAVTFGVCKYDESGVKSNLLKLTFDEVKSLNVPTPQANGQQVRDYYVQPGWAYRAIYNENSNSLSFEPMDGGNFEPMKNVMPYIGILGTNFKQPVKRTTRHDFSKDGNHLMGNTDLGWQEAYIEYGPGGQPLFNADGKAYYNTVWPPRENILMISDVGTGVDPIPVSSDRLTMKRYNNAERKTGQEWMDDLKTEDSDQYTNLVLEPGTTYVRFTAPNMWMLGEFKIWTGWSGEKVNWGALWDRHVYWGPAKGDENNPQDGLSSLVTHKTLGTSFEALNYYTPKDKNGKYTRSYYRTLEIFIPLKDENTAIDFEGAKIYATEADGGAQIDALAKDMNAGYNPTLATRIPDGYRVQEYKITRYAFEPNVPTTEYAEKFLPVDRDRKESRDGGAIVASGSPEEMANLNWTNNSQFNDFFKAQMDPADAFGGKYIDDGPYKEGKYIYRLEVTFVDTEGIKTKYADVWSPRVEIIDVNYNLNAYPRQLIKLKDEINGFNCITYNPSMNGKLVKLEEVDGTEKITKVDNADLPVAETRKIYDETGQWTNLSAIVSTLPMQFIRQGVSREVTIYRATRDDATEPVEMHNIQGTNFYVALFHNATDIRKVPFKIEFQGEITLDDNKTITAPESPAESSIEYTPTFPLPYLGTPKFEMVAHSENDNWNINNSFSDLHNWTFTHEHVNGGTTSNKNAIGHELQMTIPVHMPNISSAYTTELKKAVYSKLTDLKVMHNGTAHSVKVTDTSKTPAIVYRNQSPFDWLSPADNNSMWDGDEHEYVIDGSYAGIDTYRPNDATPVVAKLKPGLIEPKLTFQMYGELYREDGKPFNQSDFLSYPYNDVINARVYLTAINDFPEEGTGSAESENQAFLNKDLDPLEIGEKAVYVFHATSNFTDERCENANVEKSFAFHVQDDLFTDEYIDGKGVTQKGKLLKEGVVFKQNIENGVPKETPEQIQARIAEWMNSIEVEIGYAHIFDAKAKDGDKVAESHYEGLSGETFPGVKKTATSAPENAPAQHVYSDTPKNYRKRGSYSNATKDLGEYDDSYLFSPIYKVQNVSVASGNITTGIGEIITDEATDAEPVYYNLQGVRVANPGKGLYIKVTGNRSEKVIL